MPASIKRINLHEAINDKAANESRASGERMMGARNLVKAAYPELQLIMLVGNKTNKIYGSALVVFEYGGDEEWSPDDRMCSDMCLLTPDGKMRILLGVKENEIEKVMKSFLLDWQKG